MWPRAAAWPEPTSRAPRRAELRKKMEAVLADPEDYGKDMRGPRRGQRGCRVARNYRLLWSVDGSAVRFLMAVSKEDPVYSPFGA